MASEPLRLSYRAWARRAGREWQLTVPGLPGLTIAGRTLSEATDEARRKLAAALEVPSDSFDVVVEDVA